MRRPKHQVTGGEDLFVGIDLHKNRWHVTIRTVDLELFSASIPGNWESLQRILARYARPHLAPSRFSSHSRSNRQQLAGAKAFSSASSNRRDC
jgi:hypothetical protein